MNKENSNEDNPENLIFCDMKNFDKHLNPLINDFQLSFFEEFNKNKSESLPQFKNSLLVPNFENIQQSFSKEI